MKLKLFLPPMLFGFLLHNGCNSKLEPQNTNSTVILMTEAPRSVPVNRDSEQTIEQIIRATPPELLQRQHCEPTEEIEMEMSGRLPPVRVRFDASSSTADCGKIIRYEWDFGDGKSGSGARVSHLYTKPGSYPATITLTDNNGNSTLIKSEYVVLISKPFLISGKVVDSAGDGLSNITLQIESENDFLLHSDKNGNFKVSKAASDIFYRITPKKAGYIFEPRTINFTSSGENKEANFVGTREQIWQQEH